MVSADGCLAWELGFGEGEWIEGWMEQKCMIDLYMVGEVEIPRVFLRVKGM